MTSPVVCCFAVHVPPVLLESDTVARWLGLSRLSDCLDLIHVGAHLGPCPLTGVHRATRRGLRPLSGSFYTPDLSGDGSPSLYVGSHPLAPGDASCLPAYVAVLDLL